MGRLGITIGAGKFVDEFLSSSSCAGVTVGVTPASQIHDRFEIPDNARIIIEDIRLSFWSRIFTMKEDKRNISYKFNDVTIWKRKSNCQNS